MKPSQLARLLGVKVERRPAPPVAGIRLMAEYSPDPPTIIVYTTALEERAIAHELFHHLGGRDERAARAFAEAWVVRSAGLRPAGRSVDD